jgi:GntR family transcriptional regulator, colanic acid and biofilm gene transcriptional regulator
MIELVKGSLSQRTYDALRLALLRGDFHPGERLLIQDLAERFGTSVTPVREACLRLVTEQALELKSGRFVSVPPLTHSRYWQIRLIRLALEGLATELAVSNAKTTDISKLADLHEAFVEAEKSGRRDDARRLNSEFHFALYRLCQMPMLVNQIESMWVSMGPIFNLYYNRQAEEYAGAEAHVHLLEAMRRMDSLAARKAIESDIERGGRVILKFFDDTALSLADDMVPMLV